jgi:plasmid stabilization system protein ParE
MNPTFQLTAQAVEDLDAIWLRIAEDNPEAAERVEMEISPPVGGSRNIHA